MKKTRIFLIAVLMVLVLSGCGENSKPTPTSLSTDTPAPTNTSTPTEPPTEVPQQFSLDPEQVVDGGFFSYRTIDGLWSLENYGQVTIGTEEENTILIFGAEY
jgi:PBP1b-binding outer membrane lipoprotein LpoB